MNSSDEHLSTISHLKKALRDRDSDIEKAALFGKQLLEDKEKLTEQIDELLSENESLKQNKYSLKIDLETQVQTVNAQLYELTQHHTDYDKLEIKCKALQKENIQQKQTINNLINEKHDSEKALMEANNENTSLKNKIALQEQSLQNRFELSVIVEDVIKDDEFNIEYYKMKNVQLQETISNLHYELENSKLEENRLSALVSKLEEAVAERDQELKSYSVEIQKARDVTSELQGEIELLKLEQTDVTRRGNSVFGELDDRRKLVEKEYKLLADKYTNMLKNYENNQSELSRCKGQIAILLSMTSRHYHEVYITKLEDQLGDAKREIETLTAMLDQYLKQQKQQANNDVSSFKNDEYDYLRVMLQKAQEKNKILENDMMTLRLEKNSVTDLLTSTQHNLYATQNDLDAMKLENLKLKEQIQELTAKPDDKVPVKPEPKVEYLPWYKPPSCENSECTEIVLQESNKANVPENKESETIECSKDNAETNKNVSTSEKYALKSWNNNAGDSSKENKLGLYKERFKSLPQRKKNDGECRQQ